MAATPPDPTAQAAGARGQNDPIPVRAAEEAREEARAELLLDGFEALAEGLGHFTPVPFVGALARFGWMTYKKIPKICDRVDLYKIGSTMLHHARRRVLVVSTIRNEDFPSGDPCEDDKSSDIRDYFISLHALARRNRANPNVMLPLFRFCDLTDEDKCREAFSLLYYGRTVEIRQSEIPVEFLITDGDALLVGFPTRDQLFGGFYSRDRNQTTVMTQWIKSFENQRCRTPLELAAVVRGCGVDHSSECLCRAAELLGDRHPLADCEREFNRMSSWYDRLYRRVNPSKYYHPLAEFLKAELGKQELTWLDCGCGHGFGSEVLGSNGIAFWGLDVSFDLLRQGRQPAPGKQSRQSRFVRADFISCLMGVEPHAVPGKAVDQRAAAWKQGPSREKMPKKFDVIACQGNTLDFLLGRVEKTLAFYLFRKHLNPGGFLIISGSTFVDERGDPLQSVPRLLPGPSDTPLEYRFRWSGNYTEMSIFEVGPNKEAGRVVLHPVSESWVQDKLRYLGFSRVPSADLSKFGIDGWYAPAGGSPYYLWVFKFDEEN